ncbi:MAG: hypothetical protein Q7V88_16875 [Actinomycetota bacterium]|nr:hypothetical protein [Actinomycetota bacterium]
MQHVQALEAKIRQLESRVDELEGGGERRSTRRSMLRLAGAAAAGGAVAVLGGHDGAAAGTGLMSYGASNDAGTSTTSLHSSSGVTLSVGNSSTGYAVYGQSAGSGTGVYGTVVSPSVSAYGVWGSISGTTGFPVVASGGSAQLWLTGSGHAAMPVVNFHAVGEIVAAADAGLYCSVGAGTPGTWRTLAHPNAAGAFFPVTPKRVYDSRVPAPGTRIAASEYRTISIQTSINPDTGLPTFDNLVPAGATAIAFNLTVVNTAGAGNLAVNPGEVTVISSSTINWNTSGTVLANASVVKLNSNRQITVLCSGGGTTSTHFLIDVLGYYR